MNSEKFNSFGFEKSIEPSGRGCCAVSYSKAALTKNSQRKMKRQKLKLQMAMTIIF
jgi:hypothetical protein